MGVAAVKPARQSLPVAFVARGCIGVLAGMIGLGGAEFRLPLLVGAFGFLALQAVILNKAMSLVVVIAALPARLPAVPYGELEPHWPIVVNLLAGSLVGAWVGATWATRMRSATLHRLLALLLVGIAATLVATHLGSVSSLDLAQGGAIQVACGVVAGAVIGTVAALTGVAGGELLIPTIVLLYGIDIKVAGSLSLAVSLPTMLVAFARYSQDRSFEVLRLNRGFVIAMSLGSVAGTVLGGLMLDVAPSRVLVLVLAALLALSAIRMWRDDGLTKAA